ncbi:MAG TPA: hypothetical protein ENH62_04455 [Marinobacter sp.]|nr:hypothetical protein [Marinobacter sp.]
MSDDREIHDAPKDPDHFTREECRKVVQLVKAPTGVTPPQPPSAEEQDLALISQHGDDFQRYTIELAQRYGAARELSIAQTKIDEAVMWLLKYLANREGA